MKRKRTPPQRLKHAIRVARKLERELCAKKPTNKTFVGLGMLVRNRRIAEAILALGERHAYEGRMLLRSMIEIQINWSWIRHGRGHSRALRFMRFDPIERKQITQDIQSVLPKSRAVKSLSKLSAERSATRHLFRRRSGKSGKLIWDAHWASLPSLRDRYVALRKAEGADPSDTFIYGLYRWASSAVHGGPVSLSEVVHVPRSRPVPMRQPERNPTAQISAAASTLAAMVTQLASDARLVRRLGTDLSGLVAEMRSRVEENTRRRKDAS